MSVDISHIIKNSFRQVGNRMQTEQFVKETIDKLKQNLLIGDADGIIEVNYDGEDNKTTIELPVYDVTFYLHNGFWDIESYYRYSDIVFAHNGMFYLRRLTFDIAKALGEYEAWYTDEFHTWNGNFIDNAETTFDQWYQRVSDDIDKSIPEFDEKQILADQSNYHEIVYHDSFKECIELFDNLQSKLPNFKLLGLKQFGYGYLRCERDGELFLMNEKTLKPMFNEPIDGMSATLNGPEFIVKKGGLSAVVDGNGNYLTDFVKGSFKWKWTNQENNKLRRFIYNETAKIYFVR